MVSVLDLNNGSSGAQVINVQQAINDNISNIATNTANISTNTTNIGTNTSNIATNTADIATLQGDYVSKTLTESIGGDKTFSGATTTFTNDVIINGDMTVNGTFTTINSSVLDVVDANITVSKGGNQAAADDQAGLTVEMSDATDAKIIYDKDADLFFRMGEAASEKEVAGIVKDTEANIFATGTPLTGVRYHATDTGKNWYWNEVTMQFEQGGGGAGGGGLDVFSTQQFEETGYTNNASGNNIAFNGVGPLDGTFALETTSPISGDQSWKYTASTASNNDWLEFEVIDLDLKQRSTDIKVRLSADMSGFSNDITFVVYDKTNSAVLSSTLDVLTASTNRTFYEFSVFVPSNCAQISYGVHIDNGATDTESFLIDDVEWSTNPFVTSDVLEEQVATYTGYLSRNPSNHMKLKTLETSEGSSLFSIDNTGDHTRYTFLRECSFIATVAASGSGSSGTVDTLHVSSSDVLLKKALGAIGPSGAGASSITSYAQAGDYILMQVNTITPNDNIFNNFSLKAQATSPHIVTPAKSNMTDWVEAGPILITADTTDPTKASVTTDSLKWRRVGDSMEVMMTFHKGAGGTSGSGEYKFRIPSEFSVDESKIALNQTAGNIDGTVVGGARVSNVLTDNTTSSQEGLAIYAGDSSIKIQTDGGATANISYFSSSANFSFSGAFYMSARFTVPIAEWSSDATFLAAVPVQKVAIIRHKETSGTTSGSFNSGSYITRVLNDIENGGFATLNSNQVGLPAGEYVIEAFGAVKDVNTNKMRWQNISDGTTEVLGGVHFTGATTDAKLYGKFTITSQKTFELQHRCSTTRATDGFGGAASYGDDEIFTQVKITKLR